MAVLALATAALGCGSESTTTVVREAPVETVERTTTVEAPARPQAKKASASTTARPKSEPTNTVGLPLDVAEELLEGDGYRVAAKNTDTAFGIVVPSNYTICTQGQPRANIVPVLAQKYGC